MTTGDLAGMLGGLSFGPQRLTGAALAAASMLFFFGAMIPLFTPLSVGVWSAQSREFLQLVAANRTAWSWTSAIFIASAALMVVGMAFLGTLLWETGSRLSVTAGLALFLCGTVLWLIDLLFRVTATFWAADALASTAALPAFFEPMQGWVGRMTDLYMILVYLASMFYGWAILEGSPFQGWLGWTFLGVGSLGTVSVILGLPSILTIPAGVHLMPLTAGAALLLRPVEG